MDTKYEHKCRVRFYEVLEGLEHGERYSKSQIATAMVVVGCDKDEAERLLKLSEKYYSPDWSEWTWQEFYEMFKEVKELA